MGIYFRAPSLDADERIEFQATAKRIWTGRSVAGKLVVTDRRAIYTPTWLDTLVGGRQWLANADDVDDVQVEEGRAVGTRRRGPAGWHETTRIDSGGESAYFAVREADRLRSALAKMRTA